MRAWTGGLALLLALFLPLGAAAQPTGWIQLDTRTNETAGDAPDPADMVDLWFGSNATHAFFRQDLVADPLLLAFSYTVYLDYPLAGAFDPDFRLVHSIVGSYLEQWNGTDWVFVENIVVTEDPTNHSVIFEVPFASIGGVLNNHMDLWFENYLGLPLFNVPVDRGPDSPGKAYRIHKKVIPNLPGLILPAFAGGLVATLLVLRRRF